MFNGLTKGQFSPTTPLGTRNKSSAGIGWLRLALQPRTRWRRCGGELGRASRSTPTRSTSPRSCVAGGRTTEPRCSSRCFAGSSNLFNEQMRFGARRDRADREPDPALERRPADRFERTEPSDGRETLRAEGARLVQELIEAWPRWARSRCSSMTSSRRPSSLALLFELSRITPTGHDRTPIRSLPEASNHRYTTS